MELGTPLGFCSQSVCSVEHNNSSARRSASPSCGRSRYSARTWKGGTSCCTPITKRSIPRRRELNSWSLASPINGVRFHLRVKLEDCDRGALDAAPFLIHVDLMTWEQADYNDWDENDDLFMDKLAQAQETDSIYRSVQRAIAAIIWTLCVEDESGLLVRVAPVNGAQQYFFVCPAPQGLVPRAPHVALQTSWTWAHVFHPPSNSFLARG